MFRQLSASYVREHVKLAYATTVYGAQGTTVATAHVLIGEHAGGSSAYVGMTRGGERNVAHLVAESIGDARTRWTEVFGRDRADLGPAQAARRAADDVERYGSRAPVRRRAAERVPSRVRAAADVSYRPPSPSAGRGVGL